MNIAAILSGGTGTRAKAGMPKQFVDLGGKMLIERTIEAFNVHPQIDEIIVVSHPDHIGILKEIQQAYKKWHLTVAGGSERYLSSWAAVRACENFEGNLLIHDAARPLITPEGIAAVYEAAKANQAAAPVLPLKDTVKELKDGKLVSTPPREGLAAVQTPQVFQADLIRAALQSAVEQELPITDDCSAVERMGIPIQPVDGWEENLKITTPMDIIMAEEILRRRG